MTSITLKIRKIKIIQLSEFELTRKITFKSYVSCFANPLRVIGIFDDV